jgi:CheY-like chemotaxis protein
VIDLRARIGALKEMLRSSLRGDIELQFDVADDIWPVKVDTAELELALVNVAVNARDAMPEGGTISVTARNVSLKTASELGPLIGDFVAIAVTDTGSGIAPSVLPKIFEPFFTTKAVGKGTGLGLSQVYGFAHQSGGVVTAESEGRGTTITIYLPRSHAEVSAHQPAADVEPGARREGTILVVEDNVEVGNVTTSLLEQLGYRVLRADNASEALQQLRGDTAVNLVFSDIVMPGGMDGLSLAREIRDRYPGVSVLLTSGYSDAVQAAENQFAILRKPFQAAALDQAIRDVLDGDRRPAGRSTQ